MLPFMIGTAIVLGIGLAIYLNNQANQPHSNANQYPVREKTTSPPVKQIKCYKVHTCAICLGDIESSDSTDLKCGHAFHTDCLADLIKNQHTKCPYCGSDIEIRSK